MKLKRIFCVVCIVGLSTLYTQVRLDRFGSKAHFLAEVERMLDNYKGYATKFPTREMKAMLSEGDKLVALTKEELDKVRD